MLRRWFNPIEKTNVRQKSRAGNNQFGQFEQLEDKRLLAWAAAWDGVTLTLNQTANDGDVIIVNRTEFGTPGFRATDNFGTSSWNFVNVQNVVVNMLDDTANRLDFQIISTFSGNVEINMGDGPRVLSFSGLGLPGSANNMAGDVTVTAGAGPQTVNMAPNAIPGNPIPYISGGATTFSLGDDFDTVVNNENFVIVGGDLNLIGVNDFRYTDFLFPEPLDANLRVGGDLNMDTSVENTESFLTEAGTFHDVDIEDDLVDQERSIISGDFNFIGGDDIDHVNLNSTYIIGDMNIDLGPGIPFFGDPQNITTTLDLPWVLGGPWFQTDGDIFIKAGDSQLGNNVTLNGYTAKSLGVAEFEMGGLQDNVTYNLNSSFFPIAQRYDVSAIMGAGDDTFEIGASVNSLAIDFGNDVGDTFVNQLSFFGFNAQYTNFQNFNFVYTAGDSNLIATQIADTGDIIADNNGGPATGIDWQIMTSLGGTASTNYADGFELNMLSDNGNNVSVSLDNPVTGSVIVNAGDGDRDIQFDGLLNNTLRNVEVTAGLGNQTLQLSQNNQLQVASLILNLGEGFDTVDDNFNNLNVTEDMVFQGVNQFVHDGFIFVGRNTLIETLDDSEESVWASNGRIFVTGALTYRGGVGRDELRLNGLGGTSIGLATSIDLGDNLFGGTQYALLNGPSTFLGNALNVESTNADFADVFEMEPSGSFNGNVTVNLGDGENTAVITGILGGAAIRDVTYTGGDGVDDVTLATTGSAVRLTATLFDGDDIFTLGSGSVITSPFVVNFGDNNDTFNNNYGPFDFDAELLGLAGFNHIFDLTNTSLTSTQISDKGPVLVDNNQPGAPIQFTTTSASEIATVSSLEINMLGGSGSSLTFDFDNPFNGDLEANLNSGPRGVEFIGDSNSILGTFDLSAGSGRQIVALAQTSPLIVGGDAQIELGNDNDSITDGRNSIDILGSLTLGGVNHYDIAGGLTVGGDFTVDNIGDTADTSVFINNSSLIVAGSFSFSGSSIVDIVDFPVSSVTTIGGDVDLALGDGNNQAILRGSIGGTEFNYSGGNGVDVVDYDMVGGPVAIDVQLGGGTDSFTLGANISAINMFVNFGDDVDVFVNNYGVFDFPVVLLGLDGFDYEYNPVTETFSASQVSSSGPVTLDTNGPGNAVRVTTNVTNVFGPAQTISFQMLDNSEDNLTVDLDSALAGDLSIDLGVGIRTVSLAGDANSIGGNLSVQGGNGPQVVNLATNQNLSVVGLADFNLGGGVDTLRPNGRAITVGGDLGWTGVNEFVNDGQLSIGGMMSVDNSADGVASQIIDNSVIAINGGDFTYMGSDAADMIILSSSSTINGNIDIKAGNGENVARLMNGFGLSVNGSISDVKYNGGSGMDSVTVGTTGNEAKVNAKLGLGDDLFTLMSGAAIAQDSLRVDFGGGGDDTFTSNYGDFDFDAKLLNLDGYNAFYDSLSGNLDIVQIADTGDVTVDNNGSNNAIRFGVGSLSSLTPAADLRLILEGGTSTNVTADFDNLRVGNTVFQLRDGDRIVNFTGDSNAYDGLLRIEAADGEQTVFVAEAAPLNVAGTFIFNGRDGADRLVAQNPISIDIAMLLRGVNSFTNDAGLNVGGDLNMVTSLETEHTTLVSNNDFVVGGNLTYLGADGPDWINFKSTGATIGGYTYIDISTSSDPAINQRVQLTGGVTTQSLVVDGGTAAAGNFFNSDSALVVGTGLSDMVVVNFSSSTTSNTVIFKGTYSGEYGTYRGGSGEDFVTFDATGDEMRFAALTGPGNDTFTIGEGAMLDFLFIDFGEGDDTLENLSSDPLPFDNYIFNL